MTVDNDENSGRLDSNYEDPGGLEEEEEEEEEEAKQKAAPKEEPAREKKPVSGETVDELISRIGEVTFGQELEEMKKKEAAKQAAKVAEQAAAKEEPASEEELAIEEEPAREKKPTSAETVDEFISRIGELTIGQELEEMQKKEAAAKAAEQVAGQAVAKAAEQAAAKQAEEGNENKSKSPQTYWDTIVGIFKWLAIPIVWLWNNFIQQSTSESIVNPEESPYNADRPVTSEVLKRRCDTTEVLDRKKSEKQEPGPEPGQGQGQGQGPAM